MLVSGSAWWSQKTDISRSTIGFIAWLNLPIPTNELRVATNAQNNAKTPPNRLRFSYDIQECLRNLVRITHDFSNRGIRGQSFEQFKTFEPNSRKTYELQELTTDNANQLRPYLILKDVNLVFYLSGYRLVHSNDASVNFIRGSRKFCLRMSYFDKGFFII